MAFMQCPSCKQFIVDGEADAGQCPYCGAALAPSNNALEASFLNKRRRRSERAETADPDAAPDAIAPEDELPAEPIAQPVTEPVDVPVAAWYEEPAEEPVDEPVEEPAAQWFAELAAEPAKEAAVQADPAPASAEPKGSLMSIRLWVCGGLLVLSALLNIFSVEINNLIADATHNYGAYQFASNVSRILGAVQQLALCAGSGLAFYFDEKGQKMNALLAVGGMAAVVSIALVASDVYHAVRFPLIMEAFGKPNLVLAVVGELARWLPYPAVLGSFVFFNDKLKKYSPLWMIGAILLWLPVRSVGLFAAAACCVGFAKHVDFEIIRAVGVKAINALPVQRNQTENGEQNMENQSSISPEKWALIKKIAIIAFAVFVLISFERAGSLIARGGANIGDIRSVGGKTMEEAYYLELGTIYKGYALAVRTFGRVTAAVLAWMGIKK